MILWFSRLPHQRLVPFPDESGLFPGELQLESLLLDELFDEGRLGRCTAGRDQILQSSCGGLGKT